MIPRNSRIWISLDIIIHAVRSGKISMDKINKSYRKIIELKTKYNLMTVPPKGSYNLAKRFSSTFFLTM